jgi:peptidoglycan hydrolase-like protein with peptidoglycan-binding domain
MSSDDAKGRVDMKRGFVVLLVIGLLAGSLVTAADAKKKKKTADPLGRPELHEGVRHPAVKQLKAAIGPWIQANVKGPQPQFDRTTAFGPGLGDAVEVFQRMNKLKPDRIVGPKVWAALDRVSKQGRERPSATPGPRMQSGAKTPTKAAQPRSAAKPKPRSPA